jgi:hypothetical protein
MHPICQAHAVGPHHGGQLVWQCKTPPIAQSHRQQSPPATPSQMPVRAGCHHPQQLLLESVAYAITGLQRVQGSPGASRTLVPASAAWAAAGPGRGLSGCRLCRSLRGCCPCPHPGQRLLQRGCLARAGCWSVRERRKALLTYVEAPWSVCSCCFGLVGSSVGCCLWSTAAAGGVTGFRARPVSTDASQVGDSVSYR